MLDVLFDNQVCSLVYMTDLTQIIEESKQSADQELQMMPARGWTSEQIHSSLETVNILVDQLFTTCTDEQRKILEGVYLSSKLIKLLVMNLNDLQAIY